jgi:hypothetical protein
MAEGVEVKAVVSGGNDWTIVGKKFAYGLLASCASIGIPYTVQFLQTEDLSSLPLWFVGSVPIIVGLLLAIQNAWVHRQKVTFVPEPPK